VTGTRCTRCNGRGRQHKLGNHSGTRDSKCNGLSNPSTARGDGVSAAYFAATGVRSVLAIRKPTLLLRWLLGLAPR
jgi:hypothetical protein